VKAMTINAAFNVSIRSRHNTMVRARLRIGWLTFTVFHQCRFVACSENVVAGSDEGDDRGGEGDPVGDGQACISPGEERCQEKCQR